MEKGLKKRKKGEKNIATETSKEEIITPEEINRITDKTRRFMEGEKDERLNEQEEIILEKITGVLYIAYKKTIEYMDKNKKGEIENDTER